MSYRKKNIILILSFVVVCFLAYQLAIKNTLDLKEQYYSIKDSQQNEQNIRTKIGQLSAQKRYLDSLVAVNKITTTNLQNELLVRLNSLCDKHQCEIINFEEPHVDSLRGIENTYHQFGLKGNYKQIINTIYDLEYDRNLGQLVSVQFLKKRDYKRNRVYLTADILIKNTQ